MGWMPHSHYRPARPAPAGPPGALGKSTWRSAAGYKPSGQHRKLVSAQHLSDSWENLGTPRRRKKRHTWGLQIKERQGEETRELLGRAFLHLSLYKMRLKNKNERHVLRLLVPAGPPRRAAWVQDLAPDSSFLRRCTLAGSSDGPSPRGPVPYGGDAFPTFSFPRAGPGSSPLYLSIRLSA